ncbi:MAG: hypothetical protein HQL71_07985 [Magnetococcales bacterium]|nr:hypothetical protein [Magnetococcales bacterium]
MHIQTQQNRVELNGLIQSHDAIGFHKTKKTMGYSNGLSVAIKNMKGKSKKKIGSKLTNCPDGESHHPAVCVRGWRGDVCKSCQYVGI